MNFELIYYAAVRWSVRARGSGRGTYEADYSVAFGIIVFWKEEMTWRGGKSWKIN